MSFSETWFLLEQEGLLAHACLCNGLTARRNANTPVARTETRQAPRDQRITLT